MIETKEIPAFWLNCKPKRCKLQLIQASRERERPEKASRTLIEFLRSLKFPARCSGIQRRGRETEIEWRFDEFFMFAAVAEYVQDASAP